MCDDTLDPVYMKTHPELVSVRRVDTRRNTLKRVNTVLPDPIGLDNPALELYEQAVQHTDAVVVVEDEPNHVQGANYGGNSVSFPPPEQIYNNLDREQQILGLRKSLGRVRSLAANRQSLKGKTSLLPGAADFTRSWQGVEKYLREQLKDSDPETLIALKKPFWQRQWFAVTSYVVICFLLVGAIIAIACDQAIIRPNRILKGQIVPSTTTTAPAVQDQGPEPVFVPFTSMLQDSAPITTVVSTDTTTPLSSTTTDATTVGFAPAISTLESTTTGSLPQETTATEMSNTEVQWTTEQAVVADTTSPDLFHVPVTSLPTTVTPPVPTTVTSEQVSPNDWLYLLSLPGPLQGISSGANNAL